MLPKKNMKKKNIFFASSWAIFFFDIGSDGNNFFSIGLIRNLVKEIFTLVNN